MDCRQVTEVMFLFADNEMEEDLLVVFRAHLDGCPPCARQMDYTRQLLALVRERCCRQQAPRHLRERILMSLPHRGRKPQLEKQ